MKFISMLLWFGLLSLPAMSQHSQTKKTVPDKNKPVLLVEAACGQCQLGLPGKSCDLAIRLNGQAYFVDGTDIDSHGDAHDKDGFCNAIRKANVQGEIIGNRFKASYFQILPQPDKKEKLGN